MTIEAKTLRGTETSSFVSVPMAKDLRSAGLGWRPRRFDLFHIPDRNLDDEVFVIADLSTEVQVLVDGIAVISFNGAVEWSLDYILTQEVVWLPTEGQLRDRLGAAFVALALERGRFVCRIHHAGRTTEHHASTAPDAYATAVLTLLQNP